MAVNDPTNKNTAHDAHTQISTNVLPGPNATFPQVKGTRDLLDDKAALAFHDAFLMGWRLKELKNRVLLETYTLNPIDRESDSTPPTEPDKENFNTLVDNLLQKFLPVQVDSNEQEKTSSLDES